MPRTSRQAARPALLVRQSGYRHRHQAAVPLPGQPAGPQLRLAERGGGAAPAPPPRRLPLAPARCGHPAAQADQRLHGETGETQRAGQHEVRQENTSSVLLQPDPFTELSDSVV